MRYLRAGSGPALILLHGLLGYSFSWRFTMPALAPYATVYAPDMMGAGFSDRPVGIDHSMRGTARRLLQFIERLGISSFDLLGTSHGGAVAMMAAAECLKREFWFAHLRRLVLVAPVNPYSAHGRRLAPFVGSKFGTALFRLTSAHMRFSYPYWHCSHVWRPRPHSPWNSGRLYGAAGYAGIVRTRAEHCAHLDEDLRELEAALPKLASIPTLLMWGGKDSAVYASSAAPLAKYFPNSELIVFPGVGHLPYEECPEEFNRALIEFLTREKLPA